MDEENYIKSIRNKDDKSILLLVIYISLVTKIVGKEIAF